MVLMISGVQESQLTHESASIVFCLFQASSAKSLQFFARAILQGDPEDIRPCFGLFELILRDEAKQETHVPRERKKSEID